MAIETLEHVEASIFNGVEGAKAFVLQTGAEITGEDQAMLMALHSRSPAPVAEHLVKLAEQGSGKFMERFFVEYGHKSIGDCGNTAIFVEGVSMLTAKAIQDSALYRGQECSTRYIDFSDQPFVPPAGLNDLEEVYGMLRGFYVDNFALVERHLTNLYPDKKGEGEKYEKAIRARAFDILRGFLPAGASTNLAWNADIRLATDRLLTLRNHPLQEVRQTAEALQSALRESHPNSFDGKRYEGQEVYVSEVMANDYYLDDSRGIPKRGVGVDLSRLSSEDLEQYRHLFEKRGEKTELPKFLDEAGQVRMGFELDFGSFRDIQRHRAVTIRMPLLDTSRGFEPWYLNQLPDSLRGQADKLLGAVEDKLAKADIGRHNRQYGVPMGYKIPCRVTGGLPGMTYMTELRSTAPVHPTLRKKIQLAGKKLTAAMIAEMGIDPNLHLDTSRAQFDTKRGSQDIVERKAA